MDASTNSAASTSLPIDPPDDLPPDLPPELPRWEFATPGPLRERLNGLALAGVKTGTFDIAEDAEAGHPLSVMIGSDGTELAIIELVSSVELAAGDVTWEQVQSEGESFTSVEDWWAGHARFWSQFGYALEDSTLLVYEMFRVVEVLPGSSAARYPVVELLVPVDEVELASDDLYDFDLLGIEEVSEGTATSPATTTGGRLIPSGHVLLRVGFASDALAAAAEAGIDRKWKPRFEVIIGDDWLDAWRETFEPFRCGRMLVTPAWWPAEAVRAHPVGGSPSVDDLVINLDPERSWGTGAHDSTSLMLGLLQDLDVDAAASVLDCGCGSGILSVAARKLGWSTVHGVDVEPSAVDVTLKNAQRNDVDGVSASTRPLSELDSESFGLVMANILTPVLIDLASELVRLRQPGAPVLLAGLIDKQVDRVVAAFAPLRLHTIRESGVWRGLILND